MPDTFDLVATDPDERHVAAADRLAAGTLVRLDGMLLLRQAGTCLLCDLVDPAPDARRCANEYEVMVENSQRAFERAPLLAHLPGLVARWRVIDGSEPEPEVLWPL